MEAVKNLVKVLFKPSRVFGWARENPNWWMPAITLVLISVIVAVVSTPIGAEEALKQMKENADQMPPGAIAQAEQMINSPIGIMFAVVTSLFGVAISLLIQSALLHLGASILGGRSKFTVGMATVAYANMPTALQQIIQSIYMVVTGKIAMAGLSTLLPKDQIGTPLAALLGRIDIFSIWAIVLLVIGFSTTYQISKGKAAAISIGYWLLGTIVLVAMAAIGSAVSPM